VQFPGKAQPLLNHHPRAPPGCWPGSSGGSRLLRMSPGMSCSPFLIGGGRLHQVTVVTGGHGDDGHHRVRPAGPGKDAGEPAGPCGGTGPTCRLRRAAGARSGALIICGRGSAPSRELWALSFPRSYPALYYTDSAIRIRVTPFPISRLVFGRARGLSRDIRCLDGCRPRCIGGAPSRITGYCAHPTRGRVSLALRSWGRSLRPT
jgi:hypothetical protein